MDFRILFRIGKSTITPFFGRNLPDRLHRQQNEFLKPGTSAIILAQEVVNVRIVEVDGTYIEACNCKSACPCVFLSPPTEGECTALVGWHIASGNYGDLKLDGLNVAAAIHSPGTMVESKWRVALYLDDRASEDQKDALLKVFSGQVGGHPKVLADQIGEVLGVKTVPLEFHSEGKRYSLRVGDIGRAETETVTDKTRVKC